MKLEGQAQNLEADGKYQKNWKLLMTWAVGVVVEQKFAAIHLRRQLKISEDSWAEYQFQVTEMQIVSLDKMEGLRKRKNLIIKNKLQEKIYSLNMHHDLT